VLEYANLIQSVIKEYGPFDAFMAHSLGGLALMLALENNPPANNSKIALACPATESSTAANLFFDFMRLPQEVRRSFDEEVERISGMPIGWYSISRAIDKIGSPMLWIHEKTDPVTPFSDVAPLMERGLPNIEFYLTEGFAHNGIYRQQEVKEKIASFLAS
jgi:pimeloyl-ACP methyl ester carboxylesterase